MGDKVFDLKVVTRQGVAYAGAVTHVQIPGIEGSFGVLKDHAPLVALLGQGEVRADTPQGPVAIAVHGGFVEVYENLMTVLADRVEMG